MVTVDPYAGCGDQGGPRVRTLHICKHFDLQSGGGVARYISGFISALSSSGVDFSVAAPTANGEFSPDNCRVMQWRWYLLPTLISKADIVHVHGARTPVSAISAMLALVLRKRVIYTPHCYYDEGGVKGWVKKLWDRVVERRLLSYCDGVILLSDGWLRYLQERKLFVRRPHIIHNCVTESFATLPSHHREEPLSGSPAILSVSRLDPVKCIDTAIRALTVDALRDAVLHVIGAGSDGPRLHGVAQESGVADRVRFHGFLSDEKVAAIAPSADVFVLPSSQEGMPTTLIEMILRGVSVVASDIPGNRAILDLVGLDSFYALHDHRDLAAKIQIAAAAKLPDRVISETRRHFTWENQRSAILKAYGIGSGALICPTGPGG